MKNWKHGSFMTIIAIFCIFTGFIACDNGSNPQPNSYIVTFNADNGTENTTQTVTGGGKATKPANPTKDGYGFAYWFNEATDVEWNFDTVINTDLNLKAKWNINQYIVTFDADNATANTTQTVTEGGMVAKPTNPNKAYNPVGLYLGIPPTVYTFIEWQKPDGSAWYFSTDTVTADITLKAQWTVPISIDLTNEDGNNIVETAVSYVNTNSGDEYTLVLGTDVNGVEPQTLAQDNTTLTITSSGNTECKINLGSTNGSIFIVGGTNSEPCNAKLIIDGYITLQGRLDNNNPLIVVRNGGSLDLKGNAKLTGNASTAFGGGIQTSGGSGTGASVSITMSGNAEISDNTCTTGPAGGRGGGVSLTSDTLFTMNGNAIIRNNSAGLGGGVYLFNNTCTFIMNGGEISGNSASNGGGGGVYNFGTFTVTSEQVLTGIHNNTASTNPQVYNNGTFTVGGVAADSF